MFHQQMTILHYTMRWDCAQAEVAEMKTKEKQNTNTVKKAPKNNKMSLNPATDGEKPLQHHSYPVK